MRIIQKADIVGARIIDIHYTSGDVYYFTVDRGFTFNVPFAGQLWKSVEVPVGAVRCEDEKEIVSYRVAHTAESLKREPGPPLIGIEGPPSMFSRINETLRKRGARLVKESSRIDATIKQIKLRQIAGVYCGKYREELDYSSQDAEIVFDDGAILGTTFSPFGGSFYFEEQSKHGKNLEELTDFFTIPLDEEGK